MNQFPLVAEILYDAATGDVGISFGDDSDVFVLPPAAARSLGRGLIDVTADGPQARTPSHARWQ